MRVGEVYVKSLEDKQIFRRIVGIHQGKVVYSRGTDKNGICSVEAFAKWARNKKVEKKASL